MEGDGHHPKLRRLTSAGAPPSKLTVRRLALRGCVPPPAPAAAADRSGASSSGGNNKGKAVDGGGENNTTNNKKNKGKSGGRCGGQARAREAGREPDLYMPIANVIRIMREVLPLHAKISDDAKETIQECVSEYISFVTGEAHERCRQEQRKTITAQDLLYAMGRLGFEDYLGPLSLYMKRYREAEGGDPRGSLRGTVRSELSPLKRNASDAALYMQQYPVPQFPPAPVSYFPNHMAPNVPQYAYIQQPSPFFSGSGCSSSATAGGQGWLPLTPPLPLPTPPPVPLPTPTPVPLNYYRPEALAYRDMPTAAYHDVPVYLDIAPARAPEPAFAPPPPPAYSDMPVYNDLCWHNDDMAGSSSSTDAAEPSQQEAFAEFDPSLQYK